MLTNWSVHGLGPPCVCVDDADGEVPTTAGWLLHTGVVVAVALGQIDHDLAAQTVDQKLKNFTVPAVICLPASTLEFQVRNARVIFPPSSPNCRSLLVGWAVPLPSLT